MGPKLYRGVCGAGLIVSGLLASSFSAVLADHKPATAESKSPAKVADIRKAANRPEILAQSVYTLTELVLKNHIDPPTRQAMILAGLKTILALQTAPTPDLSRRVSDLKNQQELTALLRELWPKFLEAERANKKVPPGLIERAVLHGSLRPVPGDAHLLAAKETRVQGQLQANRYVGIGIALGIDQEKTKLPLLMKVIPGGPAQLGGIRAGDLIEQIDGRTVASGTPLVEVVDRLRGLEGSELTLRVRHSDSKESRKVALVRLPVMIKSVHSLNEDADEKVGMLDQTAKIAYLRIDAVNASTARELKAWEPRLREAGTRALILDLRGTRAGGDFDTYHAALLLADALLDGKPLGKLRTREGDRDFTADRESLFRDWPLAILINESTDGPAEWVAAALQDATPAEAKQRHAIVVGVPSHGDGLVRSAIAVPGIDESVILATGVWQRPNAERQRKETLKAHEDRDQGRSGVDSMDDAELARLWRVIPDVPLKETVSQVRFTEGKVIAVTQSAKAPAKSAAPAEKPAPQNYTMPEGGRPKGAKPDAFEEAAIAALRGQLVSANKTAPNAKG
jgi:carboxyl-terminal processing protease